MKTFIAFLVCGLLGLSQVEAAPEAISFNNDSSQFFHADMGSIGLYPALGGGYRLRRGHHGWDISGKTCPGVASDAKGLYLFYPTEGGLYLGAGPGFSHYVEAMPRFTGTANGVLGWQKRTKKGHHLFVQAESSSLIHQHPLSDTYPSLTLGFGF